MTWNLTSESLPDIPDRAPAKNWMGYRCVTVLTTDSDDELNLDDETGPAVRLLQYRAFGGDDHLDPEPPHWHLPERGEQPAPKRWMYIPATEGTR